MDAIEFAVIIGGVIFIKESSCNTLVLATRA